MPLNGSEFMDQPWNTTFSPFTNFFENITGNGAVFYLIPFIVLTFGIYFKTKQPVMASLFMLASGSLLASSGYLVGMPEISAAFILFTAMGFVALFVSLLFQKK